MAKQSKPAIRFKGFTDAWEQRKLGEIAVFSKGVGYSKNDLCEEGTPIILYGRLYTKYETCIFDVDTFVKEKAGSVYSKGGEVIVPASGETAEDISIASVVVKPGILLGGDLNIVSPTAEYDSAFLALTISSGATHKYLSSLAQGKSVVHLHNSDIQSVSAKFPTKREQEKIHLIFGKIDTLITLHQRKYDKLQVLKKAMLEKMFPKNGSSVPEIRFKGFTDAWEQRKAKDLCSISTGKSNTQDRVDDGIYPFYVRSPIVEHSNRYLFDEEAVLTVGDGVGTGKVFHYVNGKYDLHQRVYRMFDFSEEITAKYFYYYFSNHFYDRVMAMTAKTSVDSVRYEMIADMDIALPKVKEQMAISAYFDRLDHLITLHQRELEKLQNIKKSMLEKMFV